MINYVYRYAIVAGQDAWKWQQEGRLVWATANTEQAAIREMKSDAQRRGDVARIRDTSLMRPKERGRGMER